MQREYIHLNPWKCCHFLTKFSSLVAPKVVEVTTLSACWWQNISSEGQRFGLNVSGGSQARYIILSWLFFLRQIQLTPMEVIWNLEFQFWLSVPRNSMELRWKPDIHCLQEVITDCQLCYMFLNIKRNIFNPWSICPHCVILTHQ